MKTLGRGWEGKEKGQNRKFFISGSEKEGQDTKLASGFEDPGRIGFESRPQGEGM